MIGKAEKVEKVAALHAKFTEAKAVVLSDYRGLNVQQMSELRSQLRGAAVELHVVKNTLARRAAEATELTSLTDYFTGPTAVALTLDNVIPMVKVLSDYAKKEPKLEIRVGIIEGQVLSPKEISAVADLPPREVLLARALASLQSPIVGFVGVLHGVLRQFLYALTAIEEAKRKAG